MHRWDGWLPWAVTTILATSTMASSGPADSDLDPPPTESRYVVSSGDGMSPDQQGYQSGCTDGRAGRSGLRVLFFGTQESDGRIRPPGTTASSPAERVSEDWVVRSAAGWVRGFAACGQASAVVALAVNNKSDGGADPARAGAAWAQLVQRVAKAATSERIVVTGGWDGEPSWSAPDWARRWVNSYVANSSRPLYAANSADGCPEDGANETCANGWTIGDVFHISTGAADTVAALPQIYRTDGVQARQWAAISRWGLRNEGVPLRLAGVLTQQTACQQRSGCARTANSPADARDQLTEALAADSAIKQTRPLAATDVRWPGDPAAP